MLRDITIGQYFPGHSFIHKMDPRMKIIASVLYIVILFVASRPLGLLLGILMVVMMYMISKISAEMVAKSLKPVVPIIIFTAVLNLFFILWIYPYLSGRRCHGSYDGGAHHVLDCRNLIADLYHLSN